MCNHFHHLSPELILQNWNSKPINLNFPINQAPWSLAVTILLLISTNLTTLGILYQWNHTIFVSKGKFKIVGTSVIHGCEALGRKRIFSVPPQNHTTHEANFLLYAYMYITLAKICTKGSILSELPVCPIISKNNIWISRFMHDIIKLMF